jgi:serine/threonine protein kinase
MVPQKLAQPVFTDESYLHRRVDIAEESFMSKTFGKRWECIQAVGEGGQAHAFLVRDRLGAPGEWVLKRLKNPKRLGRFRREVEVLKGLNTPHIPLIMDYSFEDPAYIVSPYLGMDLEKFMKSDGLSTYTALYLFSQIVEAVRDAHAAGVVHRDIKPNNVVIDVSSSTAYLIDFGICQFEEQSLILTTTDEPFGNPAFAAPECFPGREQEPSFHCDIYSLGKLLYWMVSDGKHIHRETVSEQTIAQIADNDSLIRFYIGRLLRGTICERPIDRWDANSLYFQVQITIQLIQRVAGYSRSGFVIVYDSFGVNDTFSTSSSKSATTAPQGNPPSDGDIGTAFVVPSVEDLRLESITLALALGYGVNSAELWILGDQDGVPDEQNILETFQLVNMLSTQGSTITVSSSRQPLLQAARRYWLLLSVPEPDTRVAWLSAPLDFMPHAATLVKRFDHGGWQIAESPSGPGYAFRIVARRRIDSGAL